VDAFFDPDLDEPWSHACSSSNCPKGVRVSALQSNAMSLTSNEVRAFIRSHHRAVLATMRRDGGSQLSPVLVGVDDDGSLIISTREGAMKTANVRRTGRAWVCTFEDGFFGTWVQAEGPASIESLPAAMDGLVRYYRLVAGEHADWDDYRAAMRRDRRVLLRIQIDRVGPTHAG
jgi:PPOX class probable F420-dependent enzyme